jgi:hypothetical protein
MEIQFGNAMELLRNKVAENLNLLTAVFVLENGAILQLLIVVSNLLEYRVDILLEDYMVFVDHDREPLRVKDIIDGRPKGLINDGQLLIMAHL